MLGYVILEVWGFEYGRIQITCATIGPFEREGAVVRDSEEKSKLL